MFKPLRMTDTMVVVSVSDPAIDWEAAADKDLAEAVAKWESEPVPEGGSRGSKPEHKTAAAIKDAVMTKAFRKPSVTSDLPVKAGEQVCKFTIGVVPGDEVVRINGEAKNLDQVGWRYAMVGIVDVQGMGKPKKRTIGTVEYVDPEWIRETFVRSLQAVAIEIGWYVREFNRATDEEIRG